MPIGIGYFIDDFSADFGTGDSKNFCEIRPAELILIDEQFGRFRIEIF